MDRDAINRAIAKFRENGGKIQKIDTVLPDKESKPKKRNSSSKNKTIVKENGIIVNPYKSGSRYYIIFNWLLEGGITTKEISLRLSITLGNSQCYVSTIKSQLDRNGFRLIKENEYLKIGE